MSSMFSCIPNKIPRKLKKKIRLRLLDRILFSQTIFYYKFTMPLKSFENLFQSNLSKY